MQIYRVKKWQKKADHLMNRRCDGKKSLAIFFSSPPLVNESAEYNEHKRRKHV